MVEVTKNWELCIACGCTSNRKGSEFCSECGYPIDNSDIEEENTADSDY